MLLAFLRLKKKQFKYFNHRIILIIFTALFCFIFPQIAYAYLDPGTGSYILQLFIGVLFGLLFTIKMFWGKIKIFFKSIFSRKKKDEN